MDQKPVVKMYSDFKSPYAFLAFKPGIELARKYNVNIKWRPFQLRLKGKGQRSIYSEWKVKYSYMDARRHANRLYDGQMLLKRAWMKQQMIIFLEYQFLYSMANNSGAQIGFGCSKKP